MAITADEAKRYTAAAGDALTAERVARQRAEAALEWEKAHRADDLRQLAHMQQRAERAERERDEARRFHSDEHRSRLAALDERDAALAQVEGLARAGMLAASALDGLLGDSDLPEDDRPGVLALRALIAALSSAPAPTVYTRERLVAALEARSRSHYSGASDATADAHFWAALDAHPTAKVKP